MKHTLSRILNITLCFFVGVFAIGCGKAETMDKQELERTQVAPELQGTWEAYEPEAGITTTVHFDADKATITQVECIDPECTEPAQTVSQSGTFQLSNNYKTGVLNSIVFKAADAVEVTLHIDSEAQNMDDALTLLKGEKGKVTTETTPYRARKQIARDNTMLEEVKKLSNWSRGQSKTLNKMQLEKLQSRGLKARPMIGLKKTASIKYELDNGFLQLSVGSLPVLVRK